MSEFARPKTGPARPDGIDELILPYVPANVNTGQIRNARITSDVYRIAERLQEIDSPYPLAINLTQDLGKGATAYTIVELPPGGERVVFRCNKLDARVIEHVQYLIKVPLKDRFAEAEKIMDKWEAERREAEQDDLVERIGLPMLRDLRECGFLGEYGHGPGADLARSRKSFGRG